MHPMHDSRLSWIRLAVTLAVGAVANVGMWAVIVILPDLQAEFALSRSAASLPYAVTMLGFAAGTLLIGRLLDRFSVFPLLVAAALTISAGFALSALAPGADTVTALHLVIGFASAIGFAPLIADVSHWFMARRGLAVAIAASGNYLSGAIWPVLLANIQDASGWRGTYLALALIVPALVLPLSLFLRRRMPAEAMVLAATAATARRAGIGLSAATLTALLCLAGIACCVAMSMPQVHIVALCVDLGFGSAAGARMLSLMLLGGVVSRIAFGVLSDRIGGIRTLLLASAGQMLALSLYLAADTLPGLMLVSLVFGLSQGGIVPAYAIVVREYLPPARAGALVGLVSASTIVGMALGGWLSGRIYDATLSYDWALLNGIAWNGLNLAVIALIFWRSGPRPHRTPAPTRA